MNTGKAFDLNVGKVLEAWTIAHAIRELVANALDEQVLTNTPKPRIAELAEDYWEIRDWGRGLRYEHFIQSENQEKLSSVISVIGKFGVGLKDALAVLNQNRINVEILSRHGVVTLDRVSKAGFADIETLHARISQSRDPQMVGTAIRLEGVSSHDIREALAYFLAYSDETEIELTKFGQIIRRRAEGNARIYVNGMTVAEEPNFAFSYNITSLTEVMRKALNRERTNVGRTAYQKRVRDLLLSSASSEVASTLAHDLQNIASGVNRDETGWIDVQAHACRLLSATKSIVLVTASEHLDNRSLIDYAQNEGRTVVTVPDAVLRHLHGEVDVNGHPIQSLAQFGRDRNNEFEYRFVEQSVLSNSERDVFRSHLVLIDAANVKREVFGELLISETIRPSPVHGERTLGVFRPADRSIVIVREALQSAEKFSSVFLHELAHAVSGADDVTFSFEHALTNLLGTIGSSLLKLKVPPVDTPLPIVQQAVSSTGHIGSTNAVALVSDSSAAPETGAQLCSNHQGLVAGPGCRRGRPRIWLTVRPAANSRRHAREIFKVCVKCARKIDTWAIGRFYTVRWLKPKRRPLSFR